MHVAGTTLQGDRGQKSIRTQTYQIINTVIDILNEVWGESLVESPHPLVSEQGRT